MRKIALDYSDGRYLWTTDPFGGRPLVSVSNWFYLVLCLSSRLDYYVHQRLGQLDNEWWETHRVDSTVGPQGGGTSGQVQ